MRLPAFQRVTVSSSSDPVTFARQITQFVTNVGEALDRLLSRDRAVSNTFTVTLAAVTDTAINHKLGKIPLGWMVTDNNSHATIARTNWDDKSITLEASTPCTIQFEVW